MKITEIDALTNEVIEREATQEEIAQHELEVAEFISKETEQAAARQAVLDRLGITAEEAQLILGGSN